MRPIKPLLASALLIGVGADILVNKDATALRDVLVDSSRAAYPPAQVTPH